MTLEELKKRCEQYNECPSITVLKLLEMIAVLREGLAEPFDDLAQVLQLSA